MHTLKENPTSQKISFKNILHYLRNLGRIPYSTHEERILGEELANYLEEKINKRDMEMVSRAEIVQYANGFIAEKGIRKINMEKVINYVFEEMPGVMESAKQGLEKMEAIMEKTKGAAGNIVPFRK